MSRGHKSDTPVTELLQRNKFFDDSRSAIGYDAEMKPHLLLDGVDKSRVRPLIFKKFKNLCCVCGYKLDPAAPPYAHNCGAWHHPKSCDCVDCGELRCDTTTGRGCHAHGRTGFQRAMKKKEAE